MSHTNAKFTSAHLLHRLSANGGSATLIRFATDRQACLDKLSAPVEKNA